MGMLDGLDDSDWADTSALFELCEKYGISMPFIGMHGAEPYRSLALALARKFEPSFRVRKRAGRKRVWTWPILGVLMVEVEARVVPGKSHKGVAWACKQLAKLEPWASFIERTEKRSDPAETLRSRYFEGKKIPVLKVYVEEGIKVRQLLGEEQWQKELLGIVKKSTRD